MRAIAFRKAIRLFERCGQPLDVAFVAVDLAEAHMVAGNLTEALSVAQALTPHFESLGRNAQAFGLWLDLCALILGGTKAEALAHFIEIRHSLQKADPKIRPNGV